MQEFTFNMDHPLTYVRGGKFTGNKGWIHDQRIPIDYEVIIGIQGCLYLTIGDITYNIKENDVCIVPPNIMHHGSKSLTEETSFFWLHFHPSSLSSPTREIKLPIFSHLDNVDSIILLTKYLIDKSLSNTNSINLDYAITLVLLEIDNKINFKQKICNNLVILAEEYIRVNIYENLSVKDVAKHLNYSADYISNAFRDYYGYSLKKYILKQEISEIKNLLITSSLSIKEIAQKFNFNDEKYLMRLFKKHENITISAYRKSFVKIKLNSNTVDE